MLTGIAHEVPSRLKNALGKLAYYLRGIGELPKMRSVKFHIVADGVPHDAEAYFFLVVNSATVASLKDVAPVAEIDDGKLDLLAIQRTGMPQLMRISRDLLAGHNVLGLPSVLHIQAKHFTIQADIPLESDLDGEAGPMLPLDIETVAGAVEIYCFTLSVENLKFQPPSQREVAPKGSEGVSKVGLGNSFDCVCEGTSSQITIQLPIGFYLRHSLSQPFG